ncbi:MAG: hypothetical protein RBR43_05675 [Desulfuromonadaceae bacterium]|nr:hypothetical protein [Desulfuromonas sp.]MDY0185350.1 hypothetical protein [Desulfuromonadaceae bacterium]
MKPRNLILRCYAEKKEAHWQAFCLDLNLAAQGDGLEDVKARLDEMINSYVYDATAGDDQEYAGQLLPRRAPLGFWLKYYWYKLGYCAKSGFNKPFSINLPMVPKSVH